MKVRKHAEYCSRGHLKAGDNLYVTPSTGQHHCRICKGMEPADMDGPQKPRRFHRRQGARWKEGPPVPEPPPEPEFRPAILMTWPLTLCSELPMDWMRREFHEDDEAGPSA